MSELRGVVVCHGTLGPALVASAEEITGVRGVLVAVSNTGCDRDRLEERIVEAVGGQPAVVFVDMPSGSCLFAAARRLAGAPDARVVTGVNLAMLVDFVFHRNQAPGPAADRAVETGARAIGAR
jgi:mannose/fructose-specific phosphotransferase system component IIA